MSFVGKKYFIHECRWKCSIEDNEMNCKTLRSALKGDPQAIINVHPDLTEPNIAIKRITTKAKTKFPGTMKK